MPNPLDFTGPSDQWFTKYQNICTSEEHDWQGIPLKDVAQETQEAWFASWLGDMARVVKPGGLLVLENLAVPFCENLKDEGGVPRDWWATVAQSHQEEWTIDHTTITLGNDDLRNWRYHVVMRKKDPIEEKGSGGAH